MLFIYINLFINNTFANENLKYFWDNQPQILICEDSNLDADFIYQNFLFMINKYNINLNKDSLSVSKGSCPLNIDHSHEGKIFIKDYDHSFSRYAETDSNWTMIDGIRHLNNAVIKFPNDINDSMKEKLIQHEIGHALGLIHIEGDEIMKDKPFN